LSILFGQSKFFCKTFLNLRKTMYLTIPQYSEKRQHELLVIRDCHPSILPRYLNSLSRVKFLSVTFTPLPLEFPLIEYYNIQRQNRSRKEGESVERFHREEDNDRYHEWRKENPHGYVFNHFKGLNGEMNKIHQANCFRLDRSSTTYEKFCSTDLQLISFVFSIRGDSWTYCRECMPY